MRSPTGSRRAAEIAALPLDVIAEKLKDDQALASILERICKSTGATAAAIALAEGGEIVCRASSGNAPSVGARVDPESGLSGECVRTGAIVRCEDTEADARVDRLVCRSLDLRSIMIVPVRIQGRPAGIVEVFSSRPNAFGHGDELILGQIADLVAKIAVRRREPAAPASSESATVAATVEPPVTKPQVEQEASPSTKKAVAKLKKKHVAPSRPIAEEADTKDQRTETAAKVEPKPEPATVVAASPVPAVQPPAETPKEAQAEVESAVSFGADIIITHDSDDPLISPSAGEASLALAAQRLSSLLRLSTLLSRLQRLSPLRMRIIGAGVLLAVLVVGGWQRWRANTPPQSAPMEPVKQAQPAPAPAPNAPALLVVKSNAAPAQPKPAKPARAITLPSPDIASSAVPPEIALPAGEAPPISSLLAVPVAAPTLVASKISQTSGGKLIKRIDPVYPSAALGRYGQVVLKATVNRNGQVAKLSVVSGHAALAQAAIAAVTRWRYEPLLLNGVPIEVENEIVVNFKAPGR